MPTYGGRSTTGYALACYATAAARCSCVVSRQDLWGYDAGTWWAIVGLVVGAQLLGHTLVNRVLGPISPVIVSVAILFEILGATVIARMAFDEEPPAAWPAAVLIAAGVVVVVRSTSDPLISSNPEGSSRGGATPASCPC